MRQEHNESVLHIPFGFTGCNKLVNDDLTSICEITELCFPEAKGHRVSHGISILKTKHCIFTQKGIGGNEGTD